MKVIWSLNAQDQLRQSADYIQNKFGQKARMDFLDDVFHVVPLISSFPNLGKEEPLLEGAPVVYRSLVIGWLNKIIYHINGNTIEIVALWDTRREPKKLIDGLG